MNKRKKRSGGRSALLFFVLCAGIACFILIVGKQQQQQTPGTTGDHQRQITTAEPITEENQWPATGVPVSDIEDAGLLWVVNAKHPLPDESAVLPVISAYQTIPLARANIDLNPTALEQVRKWFAAANEAGYTDLIVTSGYRTWADQVRIYDEAADKTYVQIPGGSEHQTGLAADIVRQNGALHDMDTDPAAEWLWETASEYGFILRYPKNKESITGISYESWHFRYVGAPHADYMMQHDLCLEEYADFLKNGPGYQMTIDGTTYGVYYTSSIDGVLAVPQDKTYTISGDNRGGYIVTFVV